MRATLQEIKDAAASRMHDAIPAQGRWLKAVVTGFFAYHAVPTNSSALWSFRQQTAEHWNGSLQSMTKHREAKAKFEKGSGNVFANLGLVNADELFARAQIGFHVYQILERRKLKQREISLSLASLSRTCPI